MGALSGVAVSIALLLCSPVASAAKLVVGNPQRLVASDPVDFKSFGSAVAVDGDTAMVGAQGDDGVLGEGAGAVYVFIRVSGVWQPHPVTPKLTSSSTADQVGFGHSIALSGTGMVVSGELRSTLAGVAYVFRRSGAAVSSAWVQEQQLTVAGVTSADLFGDPVAISGDTILVGAQGDTNISGAVYVFIRNAALSPPWGLQDTSAAPSCSPRPCRCTTGACKLVGNPREANAMFGRSVALSAASAIIGAPGQGTAGFAFAFQQTSGVWDAGTSLVVPAALLPPLQDAGFGYAVAVSGSWALVGAPHATLDFIEHTGSAYFFERSAGAWVARQRVISPVPVGTGEFGNAVSLSGLRAAISAPGEDSERGLIYPYSREPTTWRRGPLPISSGGGQNVGFGSLVTLSSDALFTGATLEPCVGSQCAEQGAAYAFAISDAPSVPLMGAGALAALAALLGGCGWRRVRRGQA